MSKTASQVTYSEAAGEVERIAQQLEGTLGSMRESADRVGRSPDALLQNTGDFLEASAEKLEEASTCMRGMARELRKIGELKRRKVN